MRRPKSEAEFKKMLEDQGWFTTFVPTTPGDIDILAFRPCSADPSVYEMAAYEVKERKGDYLYLQEKYERLQEFQETTGIPTYVAIKWKRGGGSSMEWQVKKPQPQYRRKEENNHT
jgi:Holliday junction resolvase